MKTFPKFTIGVFVFIVIVSLTGCDSGMSGTYTGVDNARVKSITFKSGGKAEITMMGITKEISYEMEGDKVKFTAEDNSVTIFTIDESGCLDGGSWIGRLCKE
jgi:uncharacterized lipoprotein YehR (DUF1307 family)